MSDSPTRARARRALAGLVLAMPFAQAGAQAPTRRTAPEALVRQVVALDSALFDAYNRCDLRRFASLLSDSLEFYHDQGGLTVGPTKVVDAVRTNICGKVRRELVPGTLEVYAMEGYGAVQLGVNRYRHPGREDVEPAGEGRFVHLWQQRGREWKLARVISFDHHVPARPSVP